MFVGRCIGQGVSCGALVGHYGVPASSGLHSPSTQLTNPVSASYMSDHVKSYYAGLSPQMWQHAAISANPRESG